jgi:hypothetical protein
MTNRFVWKRLPTHSLKTGRCFDDAVASWHLESPVGYICMFACESVVASSCTCFLIPLHIYNKIIHYEHTWYFYILGYKYIVVPELSYASHTRFETVNEVSLVMASTMCRVLPYSYSLFIIFINLLAKQINTTFLLKRIMFWMHIYLIILLLLLTIISIPLIIGNSTSRAVDNT